MTADRYAGLAFIDFETSGLDPTDDSVWEFTVLSVNDNRVVEYGEQIAGFQLVDIDPAAARVNNFEHRYTPEHAVTEGYAATALAAFLQGRHLVGANPAFEQAFLREMFNRHDLLPTWHHRLVDVEAMTMGHLQLPKPMGLTACADALGIGYDSDDRHTSSGDAWLAFRVYDRIVNGVVHEQRRK